MVVLILMNLARKKRTRGASRVRCITVACWNEGKLDFLGDWKDNSYCEYIKAICPMCGARYWLVKRNGKYELKDRKEGQEFDHRSNPR